MASIQGILIAIAAITFFFYMTGKTGLIIVGVLLAILMGLIYFKQNMLLYMPGKTLNKNYSSSRFAKITSLELLRYETSQIT